ncbi:hypothetical protein DN069_26145 [Streptacidiphilus pinicola]|uniref:Uncharacterized protein n=1 Tax=Streptacidiphilus pinicola TaxID=2219663 RepID=A0A2X0K604_9ACTN|nr:hypothetical protein DN069_26145 [Streptacidiphilus pinicola]
MCLGLRDWTATWAVFSYRNFNSATPEPSVLSIVALVECELLSLVRNVAWSVQNDCSTVRYARIGPRLPDAGILLLGLGVRMTRHVPAR